MPDTAAPSLTPLAPLPYHREVVAFLRSSEPELWKWASSADVRDDYADEMRLELLKANYRLDAAGHPGLVERCAAVAQRLGIAAPITLYQSSGAQGMNATLCHFANEVHMVFSGAILSALQGAELDAVLAHELAHFRLWEMEGGEFLVADRLLLAAASDPRAAPSHVQTARRFRLYTEIFADRGALAGCGELNAAVATLLKVETGLCDVSVAGYLRQADEIFSRGAMATKGLEHPETFIRARALRLWAEEDPALDGWLKATIEGPMELDELDLAGQGQMEAWTRRFLVALLSPAWFQTPRTLAHAAAFFPDFQPATLVDEALISDLRLGDPATREYLCYLLLDFAVIDPALEDVPFAAALEWSGRLEISEPFEKLAIKELGMGKRQLTKLKKEGPGILAAAAEGKL